MHVLYPVEVGEPKIDRTAWAALVASLIQQESGGNQTHFGHAVGVDRKTVARWLAGTVDVSEEKVRAVARALGIEARGLLIQVGYYSADELPMAESRVADADTAIELVRSSDLSLSAKRQLIDHLMAQREEYLRQQVAEAQRLIDLARHRGRRAG
jgi:transcriptional regulator with XRE-family HTH domain